MIIPEAIEAYLEEHTSPEPAWLAAAAAETRRVMKGHTMMIGPVEGRLLQTLVFLAGARQVLEIGTFTGYSALSMAPGLQTGGRLVTCEIDPVAAALAQRFISDSPYGDVIEIRTGPALDTLATLHGPFDFIFIDADKVGYRSYYEAALPLLSSRGVIAVDNALWGGRVIARNDDEGETGVDDADTIAMREFNEHVRADSRVVSVMLPVRDGLTLIRRA